MTTTIPKKPRTTQVPPTTPRWPVVRTAKDLTPGELRYLTVLAKQFLSTEAVARRQYERSVLHAEV
jgi:hypothetical protein